MVIGNGDSHLDSGRQNANKDPCQGPNNVDSIIMIIIYWWSDK